MKEIKLNEEECIKFIEFLSSDEEPSEQFKNAMAKSLREKEEAITYNCPKCGKPLVKSLDYMGGCGDIECCGPPIPALECTHCNRYYHEIEEAFDE